MIAGWIVRLHLMLQLMLLSRSSTAAFQRCSTHFCGRYTQTARRTTIPVLFSSLSNQDEEYLKQAVEHAKLGIGRTFPNPAVGCVLVNQESKEIIGAGFHPRAGFPHAEVFALLEAAGHVESGVEAALAVVEQKPKELVSKVEQLLKTYSSESGPEELFENTFNETPVTAYVTLEPCCHYGRTPPCAKALSMADTSRVVVGFRDPNPRVDGGGVKLLEDIGIKVDLAEGKVQKDCQNLVTNFVKRITPYELRDEYEYVSGSMRRALRSLCNKLKQENTMPEVVFGGPSLNTDANSIEDAVEELDLSAEWMEHVDEVLWKHELVVLRLSRATKKKKGAKLVGEKIADVLKAHVAQTLGHTVLLYRPGSPPVMNLDEMVVNYKKRQETKQPQEEQ